MTRSDFGIPKGYPLIPTWCSQPTDVLCLFAGNPISLGQILFPKFHEYDSSCHKELPMLVDGTTFIASYDTGAENNIISEELVRKQGLQVDAIKPGQGIFQLANGKKVSSIGRVTTWCAFARDSAVKMQCSFYVWKKLAGPGMIMGRAFLEATKTLSSFRHRLQARTSKLRMPMLREISSQTDESSTRLLCSINGHRTHVNPDTGSDLDVMSLRFAYESKYDIDTTIRKNVQLGDGTIVETVGQVHNLSVSLGHISHYKTFDILPQLASDIILGETTLEELNAYTDYQDCFERLDFGLRDYEMCIIVDLGIIQKFRAKIRQHRLFKGRRNTGAQSTSNHDPISTTASSEPALLHQIDALDQREMCRRDAAERNIRLLGEGDPAEKQRANDFEIQKRRCYEVERQRLLRGS